MRVQWSSLKTFRLHNTLWPTISLGRYYRAASLFPARQLLHHSKNTLRGFIQRTCLFQGRAKEMFIQKMFIPRMFISRIYPFQGYSLQGHVKDLSAKYLSFGLTSASNSLLGVNVIIRFENDELADLSKCWRMVVIAPCIRSLYLRAFSQSRKNNHSLSTNGKHQAHFTALHCRESTGAPHAIALCTLHFHSHTKTIIH